MSKIIPVKFHGDTLVAVKHAEDMYVAIRPICDAIGIHAERQKERIQRDAVLREGTRLKVVPTGGGPQETLCLRFDLLNGWLFSIQESRIADEAVRTRVVAYKRECYRVLHQHFFGSQGALQAERVPIEAEPLHTRRQAISEARRLFGIESARELWARLKMPTTPAMVAATSQRDLFTYTALRQE